MNIDTTLPQQDFSPYIAPLLEGLKWHGDAKALRDAAPYSTKNEPLHATAFLNTMSALGYAPKVIKIRKKDLSAELCPCLFIPLEKNTAAHGEVIIAPRDINIDTDKNPTGHAFIFHSENGLCLPSVQGTSWFASLLSRFKSTFRQVFLASFFINLLALVTPLFIMSVYDKVIGGYAPQTLNYLLIGIVLAIAVEYALRLLRTKSLSWFGARIDYIVSSAILEHLLALPASFTERANVAAQISRLKAFESVKEFFTGSLFLSFVELPFTLLLLATIALLTGPLVLIPLIIAAFFVLLLFVMHKRVKALAIRLANANAERQTLNIETLNKQETLRYAGGFDAWLKRYEKVSAESAYAGYRYNQSIAFLDTVSNALIILGGLAMIYFSVEKIWAGNMSTGAMIAALILTWRSLAPMQMACAAMPRLAQIKRNINQINRLMKIKPEYDTQRCCSQTIPQIKGKIEFYNVGLRYSKDTQPIYAGLSFTAKPGELIAITGANSTGKSTTLKLLNGLYQPQAGAIRIDDHDIRQIAPIRLRQNIAYIAQEPEFYSMSLRDNLKLVKPDATDHEINTALEKTGMLEWSKTLPSGLDTFIGDDDTTDIPRTLRHQLAFSRAYLQDAPIMLIDEMPYEFLNSKAGALFHTFLKEQRNKRTILFVTYRQDYIDLADQIIGLYNDGRPQVQKQDPDLKEEEQNA